VRGGGPPSGTDATRRGAVAIRSPTVTDDLARRLMRAWWDRVWGEADLAVLDEILADPYVRHTSAGTEALSPTAYKAKLVQYHRVLHKPVTTIDDEAVTGDRIWNRATSRGINLETGDVALVTWFIQHRIADGRIAESWIATLGGVDWTKG
jgi:hypothetical protein